MSEARARYVLAAAVLGAGALVSLSVWQASRSITSAVRELGGPMGSAARERAPAGRPIETAPQPSQPVPSERDIANRFQERAQDALTAQQPAYVDACWTRVPPARRPQLGGAFNVELRFGADGLETSREFRETGLGTPELLACMRNVKVPKIELEPPVPTNRVVVVISVP